MFTPTLSLAFLGDIFPLTFASKLAASLQKSLIPWLCAIDFSLCYTLCAPFFEKTAREARAFTAIVYGRLYCQSGAIAAGQASQ